MRLTIKRADFQSALQKLVGVVERRQIAEIYGNILISAAPDGDVSIRATNGDLECVVFTQADVDEPGDITVPAAFTLATVQNMTCDTVSLSPEPDGPRCVLKGGRSRFLIPTLPAEQFPIMAMEDPEAEFTIPAQVLAEAFSRVSFAVDTRKAVLLAGVWMSVGDERIQLAATDTHKGSSTYLDHAPALPPEGIIIPDRLFKAIETLLSKIDAPADFAWSQGKVSVRAPGLWLTSKLLDGRYPNFNGAVKAATPNPAVVFVDTAEFLAMVRRVMVAAPGVSKHIRLDVRPGFMAATARGITQSQAAEDEIDVQYDGDFFHRSFGAQFLVDVLSRIEQATIGVHFHANGATFFRGEGDDFRFVFAAGLK